MSGHWGPRWSVFIVKETEGWTLELVDTRFQHNYHECIIEWVTRSRNDQRVTIVGRHFSRDTSRQTEEDGRRYLTGLCKHKHTHTQTHAVKHKATQWHTLYVNCCLVWWHHNNTNTREAAYSAMGTASWRHQTTPTFWTICSEDVNQPTRSHQKRHGWSRFRHIINTQLEVPAVTRPPRCHLLCGLYGHVTLSLSNFTNFRSNWTHLWVGANCRHDNVTSGLQRE